MVDYLNRRIVEFRGIVLPLEFGGIKQDSEQFRVIAGGPACKDQ